MNPPEGPLPGSFRDPSGHLFFRDGHLYRQVNESYRPHYDALTGSGLYQELTGKGWLIEHEEADPGLGDRVDGDLE